MDLSTQPKRGRPQRSAADAFQAKAWFNSISNVLDIESAYVLERMIQRENVVVRSGKTITSRAWDKYKIGVRLPQDGLMKSGKPGAVIAAEHHAPESGDVFRHPIWKVMRAKTLEFDEAIRLISAFKPSIARYYVDLSDAMVSNRADSLEQNIGMPIWIDWGDFRSALDHLAAHLMILRTGIVRHLKFKRLDCTYNIAKALGPLSVSPWIGPFHEEMYDWLEANVWGDMFDEFYAAQEEESHAKGWRKSKPDWLV